MPHITRFSFPVLLTILSVVGLTFDVQAVELRRPFNENIAFNYAYDNGSGACRDYNCGTRCYSGHTGTDFPMVVGTNILAGEEGTVVAVHNGCANYGYINNTCGGRCGNYVRIRHPDGQTTIYCHMRNNSLTVSVGSTVSCGQKIGESASSGSSTGPHLHVGWRTSGGVVRDLYRGNCTSSPGAWRQQNGYREAVGTSCGCVPTTEVCDGQDNNCNGTVDSGDVCEIDYLTRAPAAYAPPITSDINGNGLQDACGRFADGWGCYLATGDGWGDFIQGDFMSDEGGWGGPHHYATIRMGDLDGDGLADVCARHSTRGYQCWRSTGTGFEPYGNAEGYTNEEGWNRPEYYTTFRLVDINGNGRDDVCARGPEGWRCRLSTGEGFGEEIQGPAWSDESGFARAHYYGTIRTGDINGNGMQDVCIRRAAGLDCFLSTGEGFERFDLIEHFSNAGGWRAMQYWSTIRLVDFDGDGRADVCARFSGGIRCLRSTEDGFEDPVLVAGLSDANGWSDPTNYMTLRVGDVNGDGAENFCARANAGMRCYGLDGEETTSIHGPAWSNDSGWDRPEYFHTISVTDIDPDRRRDLCARGAAGLICARATDDGFERIETLEAMSNAAGWNQPRYYSTLRLGSGRCRPELCNGLDDNCDGIIDSDAPTEMGRTRPLIAARLAAAHLPDHGAPGQTVQATVRFTNEGTETWAPGQVSLEAVADTIALLDDLRPHQGWSESTIPATLSSTVAPGEDGTFTFPLLVPDDVSIFDQVRFRLRTEQGPVSCPAPEVQLALGLSTGPSGPSGPGFGPDAGVLGDAVWIDSDQASRTQSASSSSCSSLGSSSPGPWLFLVALLGFFVLRRPKRRASQLILTLLVAAGLVACDSSTAPTATLEHESAPEERSSPLISDDFADPSARINSPTGRLLAIYGEWQLQGTLQPVLPNSDAPPQFEITLRRGGESLPWPLGDEKISNAVFVPPSTGGEPSLALRTTRGRLLVLDLNSGDVTQLDENIGLLVSVAANGCCLTYMRGDMGWQDDLRVARLSDASVRSITLEHNAWSPALSPAGDEVIYVSSSPEGRARLMLHDLTDEASPSRILVENAEFYSTGPQPPFWTNEGLAFTSETGAYLLDRRGQLIGRNHRTNGLLVDLKNGAFVDVGGRPVTFED